MPDQKPLEVPQMCARHQSLLVHQVGVPPTGPWRALIVMAQVALFQAVSTDKAAWEQSGGDVTKLSRLGCFACFKPDAFGEIVKTAIKGESIKALGERWVKEASDNVEESNGKADS